MSLRLSLLLLVCAWAAIYLPELGDPELRGEEIRRVLPAQAMRETGDWIVPRIAGEVYANKPPLINWAIAALFALTGSESETSARLVSALAQLALALTGFACFRREAGPTWALALGLVLLTTFSLISKGRLIEIEALYTSLVGIACFLWIRLWLDRRSPWLLWLPPYLLLGLACLLKGPIHLIFWLPFLVATLRYSGKLRQIWHPAHFVGFVVMLAVFLVWALLNMREVGSKEESVGNWVGELTMRGDVTKMEWDRWLSNPFKILGSFLPWTLPLLHSLWHWKNGRFSLNPQHPEDAVVYGSLAALAFGFLLICLTPLGVPRYLMPVYPLAAWATVALHLRLPSPLREHYESLGRRCNRILLPALLLAPWGIAILAWRNGETLSLLPLFLGSLALLAAGGLRRRPWQQQSVFLSTPLLIAAGSIALLPAMQPFQGEDERFRQAAQEVAALAPADGHIVFYADRHFRNRLTKHLRLLYYVRKPVSGMGENGTLPADAVLLVGREEAREALRQKLGSRQVESETTLKIQNVPLLVLRLVPESSAPPSPSNAPKPPGES